MFERVATRRPTPGGVCSWLPLIGLFAGTLSCGGGGNIIQGGGSQPPGSGNPGGTGGAGGSFPPPSPNGITPPGPTPPPMMKPRRMEVTADYPCPNCPKFPPPNAPACAASVPAPVIAYPPDGVLLPPNLKLFELHWTGNPSVSAYQVSFENAKTHVTVEVPCYPLPDVRKGPNRGCGLLLPAAVWNDLQEVNRGLDPVTITVRASADGKCATASPARVSILFAEEDVKGGLYYWQSATFGGLAGTTGGIYSVDFEAPDLAAKPFLASSPNGTCVGCHNVARDGVRLTIGIDDPDADDTFSDVSTHTIDGMTGMPVDGTSIAKKGGGLMSPGFQTFTHDHSKVVASTWENHNNQSWDIYDANGRMLLASPPVGGGLAATQPDMSRDDNVMVYVVPKAGTISGEGDHHFYHGSIYTSTFDAGANAFGPPAPFLMAKPDDNFYYPSFSPDTQFVILNSVAMATDTDCAYYNRRARVVLMHWPLKPGAVPIELPNLNAPTLGNRLTNSWPKWSPFVQTYRGMKLLWVTFSSNRDYGLRLANGPFDNCYPPGSPNDQPQLGSKTGNFDNCAQPQIWMAAVVVDQMRIIDSPPRQPWDRGVFGQSLTIGGREEAVGSWVPGMPLDKLRGDAFTINQTAAPADTKPTDRSYPAFWLPVQDVNAHNHTAQWTERIVSTSPPNIIF
jgi:hypothetical protein